MQDHKSKWKKITDFEYLKKWVFIFVVLTFLALAAVLFYRGTADVKTIWDAMDGRYILALIPLVLLDWFIGALRNHIYARRLKPDIPFKACWDANLANIFVGAITPSQSGGAPAQFYVLHKYGIRVTDAFAISLVNYLATMIWLPVSGWIGLKYADVHLDNALLMAIFYSAIAFFGGLFCVTLASVFAPNGLDYVFAFIGNRVGRWPRLYTFIERMRAAVVQYRKTMYDFLTGCWYMFPLTFILTVLMYSNKYVIALVLILALGLSPDIGQVLAAQAVIFLILYYAPSPGAAGIAELSIAVLMKGVVVADLMAIFTAGHRVFLLLLPALVGAIIMIRYMRKPSSDTSASTQ